MEFTLVYNLLVGFTLYLFIVYFHFCSHSSHNLLSSFCFDSSFSWNFTVERLIISSESSSFFFHFILWVFSVNTSKGLNEDKHMAQVGAQQTVFSLVLLLKVEFISLWKRFENTTEYVCRRQLCFMLWYPALELKFFPHDCRRFDYQINFLTHYTGKRLVGDFQHLAILRNLCWKEFISGALNFFENRFDFVINFTIRYFEQYLLKRIWLWETWAFF